MHAIAQPMPTAPTNDIWPSEKRMREDIAGDLLMMKQMGEDSPLSKVVPGFEAVRVDGVEVGCWLTSKDVGRADDGVIVGAQFSTDSESLALFIENDDVAAYGRVLAERKKAGRVPREDPEKELENLIAAHLREQGHDVAQQVCVPGGIVDIVDHTARVLIECKASAKLHFIFHAFEQLERYAPHFDGYSLGVGLPTCPMLQPTRNALRAMGVRVYTPADPGGDAGRDAAADRCEPHPADGGHAMRPTFDHEAAVAMVKQGRTLTEVGAAFGVSGERIRQVCAKRGVVSVVRAARAEQYERIASLRAAGASREEIAGQEGVSTCVVSAACRKHGVTDADLQRAAMAPFVEKVREGQSIRSVAMAAGVHPNVLAHWAKKAGVNSRHGRHRDRSELKNMVRQLRASGMAWGQIADRVREQEGRHIGHRALYNWAKDNLPDIISPRSERV
jgi:transposase-like protein